MKSFTGKIASGRGWVPLLALLLGAGMMISACGDEETPAPTTPTPAPPPPPAPAPEPEPTGPATPENLRVTGTTSSSITWSWNAVEGALGYQGQFSPDTTFTDADPTFIIVAPATSHTVSNLSSNMTGHFRVRAGTGTALTDLTYSDWTSSESGSTSAPPPAVPLAAPGSVSTSSVQQTSITVSWSAVDDADHYEVEQQADGGSWVGASCGGADGEVAATQCVAGGLDRGTSYAFRVRAVPASSDTTSAVSAWSTSGAVATAGTPAREPVAGGDDELTVTWESDNDSITFFWDAASDTRITHIYAVLDAGTGADPLRPACPALTVANAWKDDMRYAVALTREQQSDDSTALAPGSVLGLCVRRTWTDDEGNVQYGPASMAWAATTPLNTQPSDIPATQIQPGVKDDAQTRRTNAIDWFVTLDQGFAYEVRTVSATVADPSELGSCAADGTGSTNLSANTDNARERFRLSNLSTYTEYKACVRATNGQGESGWTELGTYQTLPGPPASVSGAADVETGTANVTGSIEWSFGASATLPEQPDGYEAKTFDNSATALAAAQGGTEPVERLTVDKCTETGTAATVNETGSGFGFSLTNLSFTRATNAQMTYTVTVLACVRAKLADAQRTSPATPHGPWRIGTRTVSVPKLTQ